MKSPQRKSMGKRKKFERVCASNTCSADTAIKSPISAELIAIINTAGNIIPKLTPPKSIKKLANITGTKALKIPNRIVPAILAKTIRFMLIGANKRRSKDLPLRSKVIVTANIDVVPNKILIAIKPGKSSKIFSPGERISCIKVQERGKMIPQLILGGLR